MAEADRVSDLVLENTSEVRRRLERIRQVGRVLENDVAPQEAIERGAADDPAVAERGITAAERERGIVDFVVRILERNDRVPAAAKLPVADPPDWSSRRTAA